MNGWGSRTSRHSKEVRPSKIMLTMRIDGKVSLGGAIPTEFRLHVRCLFCCVATSVSDGLEGRSKPNRTPREVENVLCTLSISGALVEMWRTSMPGPGVWSESPK
jgi:hypothetical protein